MSDAQAGQLIKMLLCYEETGRKEATNDDFINYVYELMLEDIDRQKDIATRRRQYSKGKGRPRQTKGRRH